MHATLTCLIPFTLASLLSRELAAQGHLYTIDGPRLGEKAGAAVANAGDADNDGHDDLLVGAQEGSTRGFRAGTARLYSGATGGLLAELHGDFKGDLFGCSVAGAGDVNRDGHADFIVGAWGDDNKGFESGSARLFSGKDGKVLKTFDGAALGNRFGWSVSGAGDVNKDGYDDVIIGAPNSDPNTKADSGTAFVYSGRSYTKLWEFHGQNAFDNYGWSVSGAGDVDRDGYSDVVIGTQQLLSNTRNGYAEVRSGKTGSVIWTFTGLVAGSFLGYSVAGAGDFNKDGWDDVIVGAYRESRNGKNSGGARVYSGQNGKVLLAVFGDSAEDEAGTSVAGAGDLNGDGYDDVVVGIPGDDNKGVNSGTVRAFSGKDGALLGQFEGQQPLIRFGQAVAGGGLVNSDQLADFIVGAPLDNSNGGLAGSAQVWTTATLSLEADRHQVSLTGRQHQSLTLRAGAGNAQKIYFLVGSVSGIKPGIKLGTVTLPLNLDPYLQITVSFPNSPLLVQSLGQLDAQGEASAKFVAIPQLPVSLVGTVFWHAFVTISSGFDFASLPVPVTLAK